MRIQSGDLWELAQRVSEKRGAAVTHRLSWLAVLSPVTLSTILALKE